MQQIEHLVVGGVGGRAGDVFDLNTGQVQAKVPFGTAADLNRAVTAAQAAQPGWAATNPQRRARVMFKRRVEAEIQPFAQLLSSEHGKVIADAKGETQRP